MINNTMVSKSDVQLTFEPQFKKTLFFCAIISLDWPPYSPDFNPLENEPAILRKTSKDKLLREKILRKISTEVIQIL